VFEQRGPQDPCTEILTILPRIQNLSKHDPYFAVVSSENHIKLSIEYFFNLRASKALHSIPYVKLRKTLKTSVNILPST
jgi:hypothetical protein